MDNGDYSPFSLLSSHEVYRNDWLAVREDRVVRPSGRRGLFGVVEMRDGATVLPITDTLQIYLVKEFKYGVNGFSIEAMSGGIDDDEDPLCGARREMREELGLEAANWVPLGIVHPFTTVGQGANHLFVAYGLTSIRGHVPNCDEVVEPIVLPFREALRLAAKGGITHSDTCALLLRVAVELGGLDFSEEAFIASRLSSEGSRVS